MEIQKVAHGGITMLLWKSNCTEPYQNMATEEYLLMTAEEPAVMLWRNSPAVIIGKNQDARAEVDFTFTESHGIKVVRRLTGGGAVFHDTGNVNYTFVRSGRHSARFFRVHKPHHGGARGTRHRRRTFRPKRLVLSADGRKFSGTAQCIYHRKKEDGSLQKVLMHHGTLLFSADLSSMSGALTPDKEKIASKGIRSVKSRRRQSVDASPTGKIRYDGGSLQELSRGLFYSKRASPREFSPADREAIKRLAAEKYETDAWLLGGFGMGEKTYRRRFDFGSVCVSLCAKDKKIEQITFSGDFFGAKVSPDWKWALLGTPLDAASLTKNLSDAGLSDYIMGAAPAEIAELIEETANANP